MRQPRVIGAPPPAELAPALAVAARAETLEDVLAARFAILDVIVQDEYTHDVVARGPGATYLCFDTT